MERKRNGRFPSPLHKAHGGGGKDRRLVKNSQAAEGQELPGCFNLGRGAPRGVPTVPRARDPPSLFLPWFWGATPFMPALSASHIPG